MNVVRGPHRIDRREFIVASIGTGLSLSAISTAYAASPPIPDTGIKLEGIDVLYAHSYTSMETGYRQLESGHLMVAAHHRLLNCQGAMFQWWLAKDKTPEEFKRWHPKDHVSIEAVEPDQPDPGRTGGVSHVKQYVGGELTETIIEGRNAEEYFDVDRLMASGVSAVVCSRGRIASAPLWGNRIVHVCRDFDWGCEVRSRFWLGPFAPVDVVPPPDTLAKLIPDSRGAGLLRHTLEEYTYLSAFLPEIYREQNT